MEITDLVEKNSTLLRLGLHLEFNDARHRVAAHLQRNIDRSEYKALPTPDTTQKNLMKFLKTSRNEEIILSKITQFHLNLDKNER